MEKQDIEVDDNFHFEEYIMIRLNDLAGEVFDEHTIDIHNDTKELREEILNTYYKDLNRIKENYGEKLSFLDTVSDLLYGGERAWETIGLEKLEEDLRERLNRDK